MILDTSKHNHKNNQPIDFGKVKAAGYKAWCGRASVGNYYIDPWFHRDYDAAQAVGLICLAYHVTVPTVNSGAQIQNFMNALDGRTPAGVVIDMEWNVKPSTPQRVTECNQIHVDAFLALPWKPEVIAYTNQNYANTYLTHGFMVPLWVASPGPGGTMNKAPLPSMPKYWNDYLMWQRSWTEAIPGVPDMTTDYSEWNGLQPIEDYFGVTGEDMTDLTPVLNVLARIEAKIDLMLNGGGSPPTGTPSIIITAEPRANARYKTGENAAGKPVLQIYPKDTAPASDRIQFQSGALLLVQPGLVTADGGAKYYQLVNKQGRNGETLFVKESEADLI